MKARPGVVVIPYAMTDAVQGKSTGALVVINRLTRLAWGFVCIKFTIAKTDIFWVYVTGQATVRVAL